MCSFLISIGDSLMTFRWFDFEIFDNLFSADSPLYLWYYLIHFQFLIPKCLLNFLCLYDSQMFGKVPTFSAKNKIKIIEMMNKH